MKVKLRTEVSVKAIRPADGFSAPRIGLLLFSVLLIFSFLDLAAAQTLSNIQLYEWHPGESLAPLILPVKSSETPEQAALRYVSALARDPDLMELFHGQPPDLINSEYKILDDSNRESRALLIANLPKDYGSNSHRVFKFASIFKKKSHDTYILPINAGLGLTVSENHEMTRQISVRFPFLVAMGGDDVTPGLYDEHHTFSKNTVPSRDIFEVALIKSYVQTGKGFLLGVCRGSQLSAVALGYKLIQDVPLLFEKSIPHSNHWHTVKVHKTPSGILSSFANLFGEILVNSLHHQAVRYTPHGPLVLAATSPDGVVEATEFKNGKGALFQFHPELMDNDLGDNILHKVIDQKNAVIPISCNRVF